MRLESAEALHKAGVSAGLGSRSARFVSKTHGGRLQSVATTKARWWERDSTANQATRTMNYLKRQEDRIRRLDPHAALDADGTPVQGGTARGRGHGGDLTMAGVLDGLPRIVSATGRVNMQALAKAAHTVGGSQHTALRAAHAVLRSPLTLTEEMVGKFTPEQLGITGFTRALTLAGIDVAGAGGAMGADWRRQALRDGAPVGAMQGAGTSGAGAPGVGPAG